MPARRGTGEAAAASAPGPAAAGRPAPATPAVVRPPYQRYAVDVRASAIDGHGVFAAEPIAAATKIGEVRGESIPVRLARIRATRSERIMIVEVSSRRAIDFSGSTDPMRFTNHGCEPNARLAITQGRVEFYALRAIAPGEELTVDYGPTHHEGRLRCRCGAERCRQWL